KKSLPTRIIVPRDGDVGGTPTPRKDSVASRTMAVATWIVARTTTGHITLGRTCRRMMRRGETPITRAGCTDSLVRSTSVAPAIGAQQVGRPAVGYPGRRQPRIRELERREVLRVVRRDHVGEKSTEDDHGGHQRGS